MKLDGWSQRCTGEVFLFRTVKPEAERRSQRNQTGRLSVDHYYVGRTRIQHPSLHDDGLVNLAQIRVVSRAEDELGLAVVRSEQEVPHRDRLHFRARTQATPVRILNAHLAWESDRVGRVGLNAKSLKRRIRAARTGPRRKSESNRETDKDS